MKHFNIAIDGPAGAGKSTIAKEVARRLGFVYVDTGAMYRTMALHFIRSGIDPKDERAVAASCRDVDVSLRYENGVQQVLLGGENVTGLIRTEEVGNMASATSVYKPVREKLVQLQQALARRENVVMDGRDIGTVVLPGADVKIFLTASPEDRARRRFDELRKRGQEADYDTVLRDIILRDEHDTRRSAAPLRQAKDALLGDTTGNSLDESLDVLLETIKERLKA